MRFNEGEATYAMLNMDDRTRFHQVMFSQASLEEFRKGVISIRDTMYEKNAKNPGGESNVMDAEDIGAMSQLFIKTMDDFTKAALARRDRASEGYKTKLKEHSEEHVLTAAEYLFATAMAFTGSPDVPFLFGEDVQNKVKESTAQIYTKYALYEISSDTAYDNQRGKNAGAMRKAYANQLMDLAKGGEAAPEELGELVAEYQALSKRQQGHGKVWKFFHRGENKARETLLKDMKEALKATLGEGFDADTANPNDVVREGVDKYVDHAVPKLMEEHCKNSEAVFGYELVGAKEEFASRRGLNDQEKLNLARDVGDKPVEKEGSVKEREGYPPSRGK